MKILKRVLFASIGLVVILLYSSPITAQITFLDTITSSEPTAISLIDLNVKIELAKEQLKNINKKIKIQPEVIHIDTLIPEYNQFIQEQTKAFKNFKQSHPNKQKVINIINKWGSYNAHLDIWQSTINTYLDENLAWLEQLKNQEQEWALTYQKVKYKAPYTVKKNVEHTHTAIKSLIRKIEKQDNRYLSLENKILLQKEAISTIMDELEIWKSSEEFSLTYPRHPPIWKISSVSNKAKHENFNPWSSFNENLNGIAKYVGSPENNVIYHLIIILIMAIWLWRLKASFKTLNFSDTDQKLIQSKNVIVNHLTPSIVFTSSIISIIYFSNTPNLLSEIIFLTALITTLPLIKPDLHIRFKGLIYFIIILFILDTLKSYVWYSSWFYRVYLFTEALLIIGVIIKMTFPYLTTRRLNLNKLSQLLVRLTPVLYIMAITSIASNILGYTNLTDLMLKVIIKGGALVIILYGILMILGGFSTGSIHYYFSKLEKVDFQYKNYIEKRTTQFIVVFAYGFLIVYLLQIIDIYENVTLWITDFISQPIEIGVISFTLGSILSFLTILIGSFVITSFISKVIDGGILDFLKLPKGVPSIISVLLRYFLIAFAFIIAMSSIGINLSQFNLMAGALGLGIGFGLQNIISNFISGLILIFERPIQTEDIVEVGTLLGEVRKIGVRSSNIRTFDGAEVVVPNSNLITHEVINWTLSDNIKRIEIKIGAAYGTDLQQVVDILKSVASEHKRALKNPEPVALFDQFGDSSLDFRLLYWVPVEYGITSKSEVSIAIYNEFNNNGISIPFPQRDINIKKEDFDALNGKS
jgi:small-conductance mechanosensitive channel